MRARLAACAGVAEVGCTGNATGVMRGTAAQHPGDGAEAGGNFAVYGEHPWQHIVTCSNECLHKELVNHVLQCTTVQSI